MGALAGSSVRDRIADLIKKFDDNPGGLDSHYRDIAAGLLSELGLSEEWSVRIGDNGTNCVRDKQLAHELAAKHPHWRVVQRMRSAWVPGE